MDSLERLIEFATALAPASAASAAAATAPEKRHHRLLAGALIAGSGASLVTGAAKMANVSLRPKLAKLAGTVSKDLGEHIGGATIHGKQVMDYIDSAQNVLNKGVTGKIAGQRLRAKSPLFPSKTLSEHYSSFRASKGEAIDAWAGEVAQRLKPKRSMPPAKKVAKQMTYDRHVEQYNALVIHHSDLMKKGYNDEQAWHHVARQPQHQEIFRRLMSDKAGDVGRYTKNTGALAAPLPIIGAGVALTTKKDKRS